MNYLIKGETLTAIADAIRKKNDEENSYKPSEMPLAILGIPAGEGEHLTGLAVTTPPTKTIYTVGEAFDPTGMVVTATVGEKFSAEVTDYTVTPETVTETDQFVTISFTLNGVTKTCKQAIAIAIAHIYGASWDGSSTKWTRTDDSAEFADPVPYVAGATKYGSPFDDLYPWSGMVRVTDDEAGELVMIPKFWYKIGYQSGTTGLTVQISTYAADGFSVSPAHMDRGDGAGERDIVYVGRYHCGDDYKSATGVLPKYGINRAKTRSNIHALGDDVWLNDFAMRLTIWLLYLVEFADWDSQATIGYGGGNGSNLENMGATDTMPYHTGTMQKSRTTYGVGVQYRYIEGLWESVFDWIDGGYNDKNGMNIILNPNDFSDTTGGVSVGVPYESTTFSYPTAFAVSDSGGFQMFYPTNEITSNGSTTTTDYWWFTNDGPTWVCGGGFGNKDDTTIGMFTFTPLGTELNEAIAKIIGSRLMKLPNA